MPTQIKSLAVMIAGWLLCFLCLGLIVLGPGSALALIVYTADDTTDQIADDSLLSLREAIDLANGDGDASRIELLPGAAYVLSRCGSDPDDTNDTGDLDVLENDDLTIVGDATNILQSCLNRGVLHDHATSALLRLEGVNLLQGEVGLHSNRATELDDVDVLGNGIGILLEFGVTLQVVDGSVSENQESGIVTSGVSNASIELLRTVVSRNGRTGIACMFCKRVHIAESSIEANGGAGSVGGGIRLLGIVGNSVDGVMEVTV